MKVKRRWSPQEDQVLRQELRKQLAKPTGKGNTINWSEVAKQLPGRNNKDCRKRYLNEMAGTLKKGPWSQEEDAKLKKLVAEHGLSWVAVSQAMGTRSADQCSKRWNHSLNPELDRQPWQDQENQRLLRALATHGTSWKDIQEKHFPARSANNVKNQYTILMRRGVVLAEDVPPCCPTRTSGKGAGASSSRAVSPDAMHSPSPDASSITVSSGPMIQPSPDRTLQHDGMSNSDPISSDGIMDIDAYRPSFMDEHDHSYAFLTPMGGVDDGFNTDFSEAFGVKYGDQSTVHGSDCPDICTPLSAAFSNSGVGVVGDNDSVNGSCPNSEGSDGSRLSWPMYPIMVSDMDMDMGGAGIAKPRQGPALSVVPRSSSVADSLSSKGDVHMIPQPSVGGDVSPRSRMTIVVDEARPETLVEVMKVLMESQARVEFRRG
ncbi:hypothetical protein MFIFM68171_06820 [Madurella fahalii]|uniref:Uncharacterized protein n=1 Tax=Madurella fahalii TaxID=1157608 RepID=A0ABQ0GFR5_9PEZI